MRLPSLSKTCEVPPYSSVAQFYDFLMRHVNYTRWASYVVDLFDLAHPDRETQANRQRVRTVLELACGTGKLLVKLSEAGFQMYGMDRAASMVQSAAARCQQARVPAHVWCGDMRDFALDLKLDAVICLYDSMNYCHKPEELTGVFAQVAKVLRPGGLFIFDVCTRWNCWRNFRNYTDREDWGQLTYHRHSYFKPIGKLQYNEFVIESAEHPGQAMRELHVQRIYSLQEIRKIAAAGSWEEAGCFRDMSRRPGTERADRVHFVFRRHS
ncbi:MAG: class I SAM-dependent DNA methyltransferase [bacterium]